MLFLGVAAADLPPPPPPLDEPEPPANAAPLLPVAPPYVDEPAPGVPAPSAVGPAVDGSDEGLVALMQLGLTCGAGVVCLGCSLVVPYIGLLVPCVLPLANGYLAALVGDRFGKNRGSAVWPIVGSYAATVGAAALALAGLVWVFGGAAIASNPVFWGSLGGGAFLLVAGIAAVPLGYALGAEPKHPGDDGTSLPGVFAPAHPAPTKRPRLPASSGIAAMRF